MKELEKLEEENRRLAELERRAAIQANIEVNTITRAERGTVVLGPIHHRTRNRNAPGEQERGNGAAGRGNQAGNARHPDRGNRQAPPDNDERIVVTPFTVRKSIKRMWRNERREQSEKDAYGLNPEGEVFEFHFSILRDRMGIKDGSKKDASLLHVLNDFCFVEKILVKKEDGRYRTALSYNKF